MGIAYIVLTFAVAVPQMKRKPQHLVLANLIASLLVMTPFLYKVVVDIAFHLLTIAVIVYQLLGPNEVASLIQLLFLGTLKMSCRLYL